MLVRANLDNGVVPGVIEFNSIDGITSFTLGDTRNEEEPIS